MDRENEPFVKAIRPVPRKFVCFPFFGPPFPFSTSFAPLLSNLKPFAINHSPQRLDARRRAPILT